MQTRRNYYLLLSGQFLGAFGDNLLLAAILCPLTYSLQAHTVDETYVSAQNALFSAVFFIPPIVLAPLAGFLNDRMPKTTWLSGGNALKVAGTLLCLAGILRAGPDFTAARPWLLAGYTIVGIGACVYSPAKYGVLPEIVPAARLVKANGTVEMLTLVAILGGLAGGAALYDRTRSLPVSLTVSLAVYGLALAMNAFMTRTPRNPQVRFTHSVRDFLASIRALVTHPRLSRILLGCSAFWFAGAAMRNNLQGWGLELFQAAGVREITNERLALLKTGMILGIVAGSVLAGQLHKLGDLSWARRYGFGLTGAILLLGLVGKCHSVIPGVVALIVSGLFAGLLLVPLNAALQAETDHSRLGKTVAIQNFCDYLGMLCGAGFLGILIHFHCDPDGMFVALSAAVFLLAVLLTFRTQPAA
jgi:LPLT family lysophospholipid transporter-like MFS transporter